jgi:hypothetical protein
VICVLAAFALAVVVPPWRDWRPVCLLLLPGILLVLPHVLWRYSYYGYPMPNTFYAKSAATPYLAQGLRYVFMYLRCYYVLLVPLVAGPLLLLNWRRHATREADGERQAMSGHAETAGGCRWLSGRALVLILVLSVSHILYVIWVGGDFMFARFLIPITPALYLALELVLQHIHRSRVRLLLAGAVLLATAFPWYPSEIRTLENPTGIVEERAFYPKGSIELAKRLGTRLREVTAGTDTRVAIYGGQAMIAYYAEFPVVIEAHGGLTDEYLAHRPLEERTRIGHEKLAPIEYLRERGVNFAVCAYVTSTSGLEVIPQSGVAAIDFGGVSGRLITYRRDVMNHLARQEGVRFYDFEGSLDHYLEGIDELPRSVIAEDYKHLRVYYFMHNDDPEREAPFLRALAGGGG